MTDHNSDNEIRSDHEGDQHADSHGGHERPSYDDVNVPVIVLVGVISMVLTFVTIWFVEGVYYQWQNSTVRSQVYEVTNTLQDEIVDSQRAKLDGDETTGIVSFDSVRTDVVQAWKSTQPALPESHDDPNGHGEANGHGDENENDPGDDGH